MVGAGPESRNAGPGRCGAENGRRLHQAGFRGKQPHPTPESLQTRQSNGHDSGDHELY